MPDVVSLLPGVLINLLTSCFRGFVNACRGRPVSMPDLMAVFRNFFLSLSCSLARMVSSERMILDEGGSNWAWWADMCGGFLVIIY